MSGTWRHGDRSGPRRLAMTQTVDPTIAGKGGGKRGFRRWVAAESIEDYSLR